MSLTTRRSLSRGAYKEQQEENRKLEEEEKERVEKEERRKKAMGGGGMQGFYKSMIDMTEQQHRSEVEAAEKVIGKAGNGSNDKVKAEQNTGAESAADLKAKGINLNDDGQIIDKRELLTAGLNVSAKPGDKSGRGSDHLRVSNTDNSLRPAGFQRNGMGSQRDAQRERQTRMMEEQLAEKNKRVREEEEEERVVLEQKAKTQKTEGDKMDAKARFLARKAAKERGEG